MASNRIEPPEGLLATLKDGQSWNYQHGYVQTKLSKDQKASLLAEYEKEAPAEALPWLLERVGRGLATPPYPTFQTWLPKKDGQPKPQKPSAPIAAIPSSPEAIKAEIARLQGAYKASLQSKVDSLRADIERMQDELIMAELELDGLS